MPEGFKFDHKNVFIGSERMTYEQCVASHVLQFFLAVRSNCRASRSETRPAKLAADRHRRGRGRTTRRRSSALSTENYEGSLRTGPSPLDNVGSGDGALIGDARAFDASAHAAARVSNRSSPPLIAPGARSARREAARRVRSAPASVPTARRTARTCCPRCPCWHLCSTDRPACRRDRCPYI